MLYRKTKDFSLEKAVEVIKAKNMINAHNESENLCDVVLKKVNNIVDPVSKLTFAEMGMRISVKEEQDFIQIEFSPPFCQVAAEFTMYIDNAVKSIPSLKKVQIRCMGQICKHENGNEMNANQVSQVRLTAPKSLLDFYENTT